MGDSRSQEDAALREHLQAVAKGIAAGDVVPVLGAGVNRCGRPSDQAFSRGRFLPSGGELTAYLAGQYGFKTSTEVEVKCPECGCKHKIIQPVSDMQDLSRVSQYAKTEKGDGPLYKELHDIFGAEYPRTRLHRFLANLPRVLRKRGYPSYQLIVTTNYDDVLERAFQLAREPFDLVIYEAKKDVPNKKARQGKFWHRAHGEPPKLIDAPQKYDKLPIEPVSGKLTRTIILKIHGAVDQARFEESSFVITEDDYIDYLTRADISKLLPVQLAAKLQRSHYLFLGYSLRDWNLRVMLRRIWGEQQLSWKSWPVQLNSSAWDRKFWAKQGVEYTTADIKKYTLSLRAQVHGLPKRAS